MTEPTTHIEEEKLVEVEEYSEEDYASVEEDVDWGSL